MSGACQEKKWKNRKQNNAEIKKRNIITYVCKKAALLEDSAVFLQVIVLWTSWKIKGKIWTSLTGKALRESGRGGKS